MSDSIAVGVAPHDLRLGPKFADVALDRLVWPLGCPERLRGATAGDLAPSDHLILFPKTAMHFQLRRGTRAQISLLMGEPAVIHARHIFLLRFSYWRFFRILTFHKALLDRVPNARMFPFGSTWVPNWRDVDTTKSKMTSLIASDKRDTDGHKLRHAIAAWCAASEARDVALLGRGYSPFAEKSDGLAPYRFSVVIENTQQENYFSEKLVDAILCDTVPIYWGCPNLERFMDTRGIIQCHSEADLRQAIERASVAEYEKRLPYIAAIKEDVSAYGDLETRAVETIRDAISTER